MCEKGQEMRERSLTMESFMSVAYRLLDGALQEARVLKNEHLRQVLDSVDVTYVARDNREALEQKIISHWSRTGGGDVSSAASARGEQEGARPRLVKKRPLEEETNVHPDHKKRSTEEGGRDAGVGVEEDVCDERSPGSVQSMACEAGNRAEGWALLVFGDGSPPVSLNMPPNTPFFIGSDPVKCNPGKVVKDEWVNPGGQRGSRVSSAHCNICLPG